MQVSQHLRNWLTTNNLQGYLQIAYVKPHPQVEEVTRQINVDKVTNKQIRRNLILNLKEGYNEVAWMSLSYISGNTRLQQKRTYHDE